MLEAIAVEQVRSLAKNLNPIERLELIHSILDLPLAEAVVEPDEWSAKIQKEADFWHSQPVEARRPYLGQYVAVHDYQVVDHDADRRALYLRVRVKYPNTPVLLTEAEARSPREFMLLSPRLERPAP